MTVIVTLQSKTSSLYPNSLRSDEVNAGDFDDETGEFELEFLGEVVISALTFKDQVKCRAGPLLVHHFTSFASR